MTPIEARLEADKAEYTDGRYDQSIRDREHLLAMVREQQGRLDAVRELHQPQDEDQLWCILEEECEECYPKAGDGTGHAMTVCSECRAKVDDVTGYIPWPCPTIAAITATEGA
ncbi:hypothetical protein QFZ79_002913 [Arthrobacter sp. V4I6]|uniref:hypothetical protein n=1 Tax=Arthrobacter sp. V4I6 TaxID=3042281 RepID=UPI00278AC262|nr:hypothetical protein [Arthrobacter sp. V4I6]MDQ0854802.1 hypothetical protein [Arthrobacter sp. V4I6]